jgi:hypothetical protein
MKAYVIPLLWLLVVDDIPKKGDNATDRARRAAIVDRIMGEPIAPRAPQYWINQAPATEPIETEPIEVVIFDFIEDVIKDDDEDEVVNPPKPAGAMDFALTEANFDSWLFGDIQDGRARRQWLEYRLRVKTTQVASKHELSPEQIKKLQLAGRGDIKRFFDQVEEMRLRFEELRANIPAGQRFLSNELCPLRTQFQTGSYGNDSLFNKTLQKIRNDGRMARAEAQ